MAISSRTNQNLKPNLAYLALCIGINIISLEALAVEPVGGENALQTINQFHIAPQPLSTALLEFSKIANIKIFYDGALTRGMESSGLSGQYSVNDALAKLLEKTGIDYSLSPSGFIKLQAKQNPGEASNSAKPVASNPQSTTTMPTVKVVGSTIYDVKDPYNEDYVLPSATAGTKTDTPIMETPLNVQVVSKQVMKDQQVITLADSLKNVSGVVINHQGNTEKDVQNVQGGELGITLRGFESSTFFRNGFRLQSGGKAMANVESVEVLKGPAAILYGLVEPGGMVNVTTKQPQVTPYYAFNQQFGSYDNYRTTVDATGPVAGNKDVLYRMNMSYQNSGSWQSFVGNEDFFVAPVLKWTISPRTQVTAEFEYNHQHQGLGSSFDPFLNGQLTRVPFNLNYAGYSPATNETFFGSINWSHQFSDDWTIKHSFSANQHSFTTKANETQFVAPADFITLLYPYPSSATVSGVDVLRDLHNDGFQKNTYSTNLDLTGHFNTFGLNHTLLLGGDYYRLNNHSRGNQPTDVITAVDLFHPVNPGVLLNNISWSNFNSNQQTDQYGLYAQDQIKLPYDLHVTGGLRYQYLHQNFDETKIGGTVDANGAIDSSSTNASRSAMSQDAVTPRVGILWHPQSWLSLYANYAENFGANTGLVWSASGQFKPVAPTSAEQYEGGIKTEFFDGRLRATLAYYDLTKTNVATGDPIHDCGGGIGSCSLAIGAVRSRGPELDVQGELLPGWNAIATYANTDIIVTKTNENNDPLNGMHVGSRMINVPRNTASFWSTYEFLDTDFKGLKFGGGVTIREGQIGTAATALDGTQSPSIKTPGYATLDLMTAYSRAVGHSKITVQLNINNLLDKRYYTNINGYWNDPGSQIFGAYASYGAPRTLMGSINIQY